MDNLFLTLGKIAGLAGISIGLLLVIFREVIKRNIFSNLTKKQSYNILRLIIIFSFSAGILGIGGWIYIEAKSSELTENDKFEVRLTQGQSHIINEIGIALKLDADINFENNLVKLWLWYPVKSQGIETTNLITYDGKVGEYMESVLQLNIRTKINVPNIGQLELNITNPVFDEANNIKAISVEIINKRP